MDAGKLRSFVNKVGAITHNQPGNISSAGFFGAAASQDSMIETLKRSVLVFASEYSKSTPNKARLAELADEVEGGLQGVRAISSIDDKKLDELLSELHDLKD